MIASLKPYPRMKASGVEWLGEVPEHWEVRRLRNITQMRVSNVDKLTTEGELPVRLCNYVDVYKNDHIDQRIRFMRATASPNEIERFRLEAGDVLITKDSEAWDDIGVPALVTEPVDDLISGYHLAILRPFADNLSGRYLFRALQSKGLAYQFHVEANGVTRYGLSHAAIKSVWVPLPSLSEQAAIVKYLDYVDQRIRRLVRAKRKLIALLTEQKQATINQAVTRGLDPDVPLKYSGVEWLGEVPAHWEVAALRLMYDQCLGKMLDAKRIIGTDLLPYLRNTDVQWDRINVDNLPKMDISESEYQRYTVRSGDLLVCEGGEVGRAAIWSGEIEICGFQKALHRLRPRNVNKQHPRFMYFALRAASNSNAFSDGHVSTIVHLTGDKLRAHRFAFPPFHEQLAIAKYLDDSLAGIDTAIAQITREIALLNEYRTRLISDVGTGKLDVREAAAALPEFDPLAASEEPDDTLDNGVDGDLDEMDAIPEEKEA